VQVLPVDLRYLQGSAELGLHYERNEVDELTGYSDADWAGDTETRKSTSGFCFLLASACISWKVSTQRCTALSTAESEIIALTACTKEAIWIRRMANDVGGQLGTVRIYEDNQAAIILTRDNKFSEKTKHMATRYFFIIEKVQDKTIEIKYIATENQLADIFTKPLARVAFSRLRHQLGLK
jgi:hypothetical protein